MINIVGYFAGELGLGIVARNLAQLVARNGVAPACSLTLAQSGRDTLTPPYPTPAAGHLNIRFRSTLLIAGAAPCHVMYNAARLLKGKTKLAILAYWELTELPESAVSFLSHADVLFGGSPFTCEVYRRYFPEKPCYELPCPLGLAQRPPKANARSLLGLPEDAALALVSFDPVSDLLRKNCEGAIRAFLASCDHHDGMLVLKVNWPLSLPKDTAHPLFQKAREIIDQVRSHPRIIVIDETYSYDRLMDLYSCVDVMLSLHRAEGLGLVMLEGLSLGKAVIATAYSGNLAFMDPAYPGLVPYQLTAAHGVQPYYQGTGVGPQSQWAEPDQDHAAALLTRVFTDKPFAAEIQSSGRRMAQAYEARALRADWLRNLVSFSSTPSSVRYSFG